MRTEDKLLSINNWRSSNLKSMPANFEKKYTCTWLLELNLITKEKHEMLSNFISDPSNKAKYTLYVNLIYKIISRHTI